MRIYYRAGLFFLPSSFFFFYETRPYRTGDGRGTGFLLYSTIEEAGRKACCSAPRLSFDFPFFFFVFFPPLLPTGTKSSTYLGIGELKGGGDISAFPWSLAFLFLFIYICLSGCQPRYMMAPLGSAGVLVKGGGR